MTAIERVIASGDAPRARDGNDCILLGDGQLAFARTINAIDRAELTIDLTTFILVEDVTGDWGLGPGAPGEASRLCASRPAHRPPAGLAFLVAPLV